MLPGFDGSGRLYRPLLAAGSERLALRPVSYPPDQPLGLDALADLARAALPARGPYLLVAESFSGPVAVRLAAARPRGLVGLVLAATYLRQPLHPLLHPLRALVGARFFGLGIPAGLVRLLMAGLDAPEDLVAEVQAAVRAVRPEVAARRGRDALAVDVRAPLADVVVPILYLAPERDRLVRAGGAEDVLAIHPDAEVVRLDTPHMIFQRAPHACLLAMEAFAARVGPTPRSAPDRIPAAH